MYFKYYLTILFYFTTCVRCLTSPETKTGKGKNEEITVRYTIRNNLAKPNFEFEQNVTSKAGQPFIRFMEQAADDDKNFQFSSTYFAKLGYFIEKLGKEINREGVLGLSYWQFVRAPSTVLPVGVSTYIPEDGDHIIMDYVLEGNCVQN
ncbi:uncharacterized protein LOC133179135 [Saccostrea echinata]|uniref:uncharacterized protein LOC133179135 n=1 Tax=Saccostrea echinata TaxID=191078 RepID=UPI002A8351E9|nr:uncharacterized protein LOC133179135 [Saccostrea echinata]